MGFVFLTFPNRIQLDITHKNVAAQRETALAQPRSMQAPVHSQSTVVKSACPIITFPRSQSTDSGVDACMGRFRTGQPCGEVSKVSPAER
jgi:hypothetical protein